MFPLADPRGRVRGFGARAMRDGQGPKYVNTREGEVFSQGPPAVRRRPSRAPAAAKAGSVVLAEGYTDVIALHQAGFANAVGVDGHGADRRAGARARRPRADRAALPRRRRRGPAGRGRGPRRVLPDRARAPRRAAARRAPTRPTSWGRRAAPSACARCSTASVPFARFAIERILERGQDDEALDARSARHPPTRARASSRDDLVKLASSRLGISPDLVESAVRWRRPPRSRVAATEAPAVPPRAGQRRAPGARPPRAVRARVPRPLRRAAGAGREEARRRRPRRVFTSPLTRLAAERLRGHLEHPGLRHRRRPRARRADPGDRPPRRPARRHPGHARARGPPARPPPPRPRDHRRPDGRREGPSEPSPPSARRCSTRSATACSRAKSPSDTRTSVRVMDRDWLEAQLTAGRSIESIAREVGKHPSTVGYWVKKHGLRSQHAAQHAARGRARRESAARARRARACRSAQIGEAAGRSDADRQHWLRRYGLRPRRGAARRAGATARAVIARECRRHGRTAWIRTGSGPLPLQALPRARRVTARRRRVKAAADRGGRRWLRPLRLRPLPGRAAVPSPRPGAEVVRALGAGSHPVAGESKGRGSEMRADVRELSRRSRRRGSLPFGSEARADLVSRAVAQYTDSGVIQSAECSAVNRVVVGSSPTPRAYRHEGRPPRRPSSFWAPLCGALITINV